MQPVPPGSKDKKAEEDAVFCLIKDGTFLLGYEEPSTGYTTGTSEDRMHLFLAVG
jgi:hypothetical protein